MTANKNTKTSTGVKKRAPKIHRTDLEWLQLFQQQAQSNMGLKDYCRPRGMSPSSFCSKRSMLFAKYKITDILKDGIPAALLSTAASESPKKIAAMPAAKKASPQPKLKSAPPVEHAQDQDVIRMVLDAETTLYIPRHQAVSFIAEYMASKAKKK